MNHKPHLSLGNKIGIGLIGGYLIHKLVPGETQDRLYGGLFLVVMMAIAIPLLILLMIPVVLLALVAVGAALSAVAFIARITYWCAFTMWPIDFGVLPRWHDRAWWHNHKLSYILLSPFILIIALVLLLIGSFCVIVLGMCP